MVDGTLPQERSDFYVYVIFRPNGEPCYVGKGRGYRWRQHAKRAHNKQLAAIYKEAACELPIVKLRENLTDTEACHLEMEFIAVIGRGCFGPLVNLTDGGEGLSGYAPSQEHREKIREKLVGRKRPPEVGAAISRAAQNRPPEWRSKQSTIRRGVPLSPEHKGQLRAAWLRRKPELADRVPKVKLTPEERSERQRQRNAGNTYGLGNKRTPEGNARVIASITRSNSTRPVTDEYREKRRAIAKAMWAKRDAAERAAWSAKAVAGLRGSGNERTRRSQKNCGRQLTLPL